MGDTAPIKEAKKKLRAVKLGNRPILNASLPDVIGPGSEGLQVALQRVLHGHELDLEQLIEDSNCFVGPFLGLAAAKGPAVWEAICCLYSDKLAQHGEPHWAAAYQLAVGNVEEAIDIYRSSGLLAEAVFVASSQLLLGSSVEQAVRCEYAAQLEAAGQLEVACSQWLLAGRPQAAVRAMSMRQTYTAMLAAAEIALQVTQNGAQDLSSQLQSVTIKAAASCLQLPATAQSMLSTALQRAGKGLTPSQPLWQSFTAGPHLLTPQQSTQQVNVTEQLPAIHDDVQQHSSGLQGRNGCQCIAEGVAAVPDGVQPLLALLQDWSGPLAASVHCILLLVQQVLVVCVEAAHRAHVAGYEQGRLPASEELLDSLLQLADSCWLASCNLCCVQSHNVNSNHYYTPRPRQLPRASSLSSEPTELTNSRATATCTSADTPTKPALSSTLPGGADAGCKPCRDVLEELWSCLYMDAGPEKSCCVKGNADSAAMQNTIYSSDKLQKKVHSAENEILSHGTQGHVHAGGKQQRAGLGEEGQVMCQGAGVDVPLPDKQQVTTMALTGAIEDQGLKGNGILTQGPVRIALGAEGGGGSQGMQEDVISNPECFSTSHAGESEVGMWTKQESVHAADTVLQSAPAAHRQVRSLGGEAGVCQLGRQCKVESPVMAERAAGESDGAVATALPGPSRAAGVCDYAIHQTHAHMEGMGPSASQLVSYLLDSGWFERWATGPGPWPGVSSLSQESGLNDSLGISADRTAEMSRSSYAASVHAKLDKNHSSKEGDIDLSQKWGHQSRESGALAVKQSNTTFDAGIVGQLTQWAVAGAVHLSLLLLVIILNISEGEHVAAPQAPTTDATPGGQSEPVTTKDTPPTSKSAASAAPPGVSATASASPMHSVSEPVAAIAMDGEPAASAAAEQSTFASQLGNSLHPIASQCNACINILTQHLIEDWRCMRTLQPVDEHKPPCGSTAHSSPPERADVVQVVQGSSEAVQCEKVEVHLLVSAEGRVSLQCLIHTDTASNGVDGGVRVGVKHASKTGCVRYSRTLLLSLQSEQCPIPSVADIPSELSLANNGEPRDRRWGGNHSPDMQGWRGQKPGWNRDNDFGGSTHQSHSKGSSKTSNRAKGKGRGHIRKHDSDVPHNGANLGL